VDANKTTLCPDPWHVPTSDDFAALVDNTDAAMLESTWGYGGYAYGSYIYDGSTYAYYWSSTEYSSGSYDAYGLGYGSSYLGAGYYTPKHLGFQVRCVK
jgi:hypothetical protein